MNELLKQACQRMNKSDYIFEKSLGIDRNSKAKYVYHILLNNNHIRKKGERPIVLRWIEDDNSFGDIEVDHGSDNSILDNHINKSKDNSTNLSGISGISDTCSYNNEKIVLYLTFQISLITKIIVKNIIISYLYLIHLVLMLQQAINNKQKFC